MGIFAVKPPELVTIAEIARHVGMTPAAFYYHFSSRDELFLEVVSQFGEQWAARAEQWWDEALTIDDVLDTAGRLLDEAAKQREHATVFFVTSRGISLSIEEVRQTYAARAASAAAAAISRAALTKGGAGAAVDGVGLVTILESSLRAQLALDTMYRTLGPRRFRDEVLELCRRVLRVEDTAA